jgi:hypothetical protein
MNRLNVPRRISDPTLGFLGTIERGTGIAGEDGWIARAPDHTQVCFALTKRTCITALYPRPAESKRR